MEYRSLYLSIFGIVLLVFWSIDYWKLFKRAELIAPAGYRIKKVNILKTLNFILGSVGILLISYALAGPRQALKFSPANIKVNDIFLVVDVSRSMLADDLKPNRLEVAKKKLREFAALRPTDRLGVVIFSERVFTLLPLTTDPSLVDQILSEIRVGFLGSGTNIGDALALAVGRAQESKTKNKVIVLLTDGVNNVGNMTPSQAADLASEFNIKVYTIGLASSKDARIPIGKGIFGQQYQKIPGGSIDLETLRMISQKTNGKSYYAQDTDSLAEILQEIQSLEKTEIKNNNQIVYDEKYLIFLLWGVIFFLLNELIKRFALREVL
jgi:Ca-activated chloride channel family protein